MKLISTRQAAEQAGVSQTTILSEIKAGKLRYKKIGAHYRTTAEWLDKWICTPCQTHNNDKKTKNNTGKLTIDKIINDYYHNHNLESPAGFGLNSGVKQKPA